MRAITSRVLRSTSAPFCRWKRGQALSPPTLAHPVPAPIWRFRPSPARDRRHITFNLPKRSTCISTKALFPLKFRWFPNLVLLVALLLAPVPALGWGAEGHEIAAGIALRELTQAARQQVSELLGGEAMIVEQSNWADEIKDRRRDTARWHFVDIPLHAPS